MEEGNQSPLRLAQLQVLCLGAGQDVGRSCVCVTLKDKTVMFDVGIHMLYTDSRRYPDFSQLYSPPATINQAVHLVLLTHFHLDHCGAMPYLTEHHGYTGPIIASTPTKALLPLMLEDYRKVITEQKKEEQFYIFTAGEVRASAERVKSIGLFETVKVNGIRVTSYYAGHVLGACMFHVEYAGLSVVYTGDYNSYADRHLGAASAPRLSPNLLITETTYATTIRDTKRDR
jgi:integrator complex subunit 11